MSLSSSRPSILSPSRRGFLKGLLWVAAAPAIVQAAHIMPVRQPLILPEPVDVWFCKTCGCRHGGCCLTKIRELLLPGLATLHGRYEAIPPQWAEIMGIDPLDTRIATS